MTEQPYYRKSGDQNTIRKDEVSDWQCELFGGLMWRPLKDKEPNWFWRWMQFLVLGNRWRRSPTK